MSVPKVIVLGASGQVGREVCELSPHAVPITRETVDLADESTYSALEQWAEPGACVINLAAFTSVDEAESPERQREVYAVNAHAPGKLAELCQRHGMRFIHVSTDYVFSGTTTVGECCGEDHPTDPINEYGRSKLRGEQAAVAHGATVVRTSWVYSGPSNRGGDFVKTMAGLAAKGVDPSVVADQWGRPTRARDLAAALVQLVEVGPSDAAGSIVHIAGGGAPTTWYEFARHVFALTGHDPARVRPIPTAEYPTPAARPLNATLCTQRWEDWVARPAQSRPAQLDPGNGSRLKPLPAWQDSLREVLR